MAGGSKRRPWEEPGESEKLQRALSYVSGGNLSYVNLLMSYRRSLFGPRRLRDIVLPLDIREAAVHALIIEDESIIAMEIEDILRDIGFKTFDIAPSPQTAIRAASQRPPDLITSDVQLKPGCGIGTVIAICESVSIPVIFITGNVADVKRRLPGCRALSKPFSPQQLASAVALALKPEAPVAFADVC